MARIVRQKPLRADAHMPSHLAMREHNCSPPVSYPLHICLRTIFLCLRQGLVFLPFGTFRAGKRSNTDAMAHGQIATPNHEEHNQMPGGKATPDHAQRKRSVGELSQGHFA